MIRYSLRCSQGHEFDDWFGNSADFDAKKEAGELCCPSCGDKSVSKAIMAPSIGKSQAAAPMPACPAMAAGMCGGGGCGSH